MAFYGSFGFLIACFPKNSRTTCSTLVLHIWDRHTNTPMQTPDEDAEPQREPRRPNQHSIQTSDILPQNLTSSRNYYPEPRQTPSNAHAPDKIETTPTSRQVSRIPGQNTRQSCPRPQANSRQLSRIPRQSPDNQPCPRASSRFSGVRPGRLAMLSGVCLGSG